MEATWTLPQWEQTSRSAAENSMLFLFVVDFLNLVCKSFVCMYVCEPGGTCRSQKRTSDHLEHDLQLGGFWELNPGPPEKRPVLLTFLKPHIVHFYWT